jgi:two-component system, NtrC family, nitrogen regulation response regulator GlnG
VPLRLPPLRERAADIPDLARHFFNLAEKEGLQRKQLDAGAIERMKAYPWPGNIRELENLIRRLAALHPHDVVTAQAIDAELDPQASQPAAPALQPAAAGAATIAGFMEGYLAQYFASHGDGLPASGLYDRVLHEVEGPLVNATLAATRGNQIKAAELLGLNRNTLRKKIRDLDIRVIRSIR